MDSAAETGKLDIDEQAAGLFGFALLQKILG